MAYEWIAPLALLTEFVGSNPCLDKMVFSGFSSSYLSLSDCMGIILDHKVTCSRREKEREEKIVAVSSVRQTQIYGQ